MSGSPFLAANYAPVSDELAVNGLLVSGNLPAGLRGTLYRNGPNPHVVPAEPYHWFTGDGRARYRNRWV